MKDRILYVIGGVLIGLFVSSFLGHKEGKPVEQPAKTIVDTVVVTLPRVVDTLTVVKPIVKYETKVDTSMVRQFIQLKEDTAKLNAYIKSIINRVYENEYNVVDGILVVSVQDSVQGVLLKQDIRIVLDEREKEYVTKTVFLQPPKRTVFFAGGGISTGNIISNPSIGILAGVRNKRGTSFMLGCNSNNEYIFNITQDLKFK